MPALKQSDRPYSGMTVPELRRALAHAQRRDKRDMEEAVTAELARRGAADG